MRYHDNSIHKMYDDEVSIASTFLSIITIPVCWEASTSSLLAHHKIRGQFL